MNMIYLLVFLLVACGKRDNNFITYTEPTSSTVQTTSNDVLKVVDDENSYRKSLGQATLSKGLSCTVQKVSSGQWLSSSSLGYNAGQGVLVMTGSSYSYTNYSGFNQPDTVSSSVHSVIPTAIQPLFVNSNFKVSCSGVIVITQNGYYNFEVSSDDGSILTVGGTKVVDNDGNHGVVTKTGVKNLKVGVHSFSLQYAQSGLGRMALIVKMDGFVLSGDLLYR